MEDVAILKNTIAKLRAEIDELKSKEHHDAILSADQRYQESQIRFRTVFETSRLGNKIITPDLKILQVNAAMVALLGLTSKDEMIGKVILDYSPPDYHKDWKFLQEKLWQKASPSFSLETCLKKKDGSLIWCQVTSILFPDNGETLGYTIIEDITEKYNLRLQREEFISVASHELKTPITSLQATIQIINRMVNEDTNVSEKLKTLAGNAERHTKKLNHLVGDLLNTTKIEKGQLALNKNIFALTDVIDGCCSHIKLKGDHNIKYTGDHSLKVTADQHKIDQVLVNMVNNAVKYAPDSHEITIHVEKSGNFTKISVTDKGHGIPADSLSKLFDRYYRADAQNKQISGLGLGLYICSDIIKRHGGEIGVESVLGFGSTFWFTLPDVNFAA
jgi:PAS domain S-box-containing protein